jgi:hypothetical protein
MAFKFASSKTVRIDIPKHGEWIDIKAQLSIAERNEITKRGVRHAGIGDDAKDQKAITSVGLDIPGAKVEKVVQYLVDWSMKDEGGTLVILRGKTEGERRDLVKALDEDTFAAIEEAIDGHEKAQGEARRGNAPAAEPTATNS